MKYVSSVIALILVVITIIFGVNLVRNQIKTLDKSTLTINQIPLSDYTKNGAKLRFRFVGPVVADEKHKEIIYEVGQGSRSVKIIKGYNATVEKEMVLSNNFNAYDSFASALYATRFTEERESQKDKKYGGECPSGNIYTAELVDVDGKVKKSLWRASCLSKTGTLNASYSTILDLFKDQFPDYGKFAADVTID